MDKSALEAKKAELEQLFESLQTQKDDTIKRMYNVQGAHALVVEQLANLNKEEEEDAAATSGRAKKPAK